MSNDDLVYLTNRILLPINNPKRGLIELLEPKLKILYIFLCEIVEAFYFLNRLQKSLNVGKFMRLGPALAFTKQANSAYNPSSYFFDFFQLAKMLIFIEPSSLPEVVLILILLQLAHNFKIILEYCNQ